MHANPNENEHVHDDMCYVESLILEHSQQGCDQDDEHSETGYNSHHVGSLFELGKLIGLVPCLNVDYTMNKCEYDCAVTGYLMENVEALVGVCSHKSKWSVFKCEEGDECNIEYGYPNKKASIKIGLEDVLIQLTSLIALPSWSEQTNQVQQGKRLEPD